MTFRFREWVAQLERRLFAAEQAAIAAERQRDKATAALANVREAADDALAELGKCPDYETAMVAASKLCGTLQFISQHAAAIAAPPATEEVT